MCLSVEHLEEKKKCSKLDIFLQYYVLSFCFKMAECLDIGIMKLTHGHI